MTMAIDKYLKCQIGSFIVKHICLVHLKNKILKRKLIFYLIIEKS